MGELADRAEREDEHDGDDDDDDDDQEEWNLADRVKMVVKSAHWMQEAMGELADRAERVQNLFNCTVPLLSGVFGLALILLMLVLYLVGFRWMILVWGINKFRKGLLGLPANQVTLF